MIMMPMIILDVLQGLDVVHDHRDDGRCFGSVNMFQVI